MLEDALVAPVGLDGLVDLLLGGVGVDDAELAGDLVAVALLVLLLLGEVALDLLLEVVVEAVELAGLEALAAVGGALGVDLEGADLVADRRVLELRVGHQVLELGLGRALRRRQGALVELGDLLYVGRQAADVVPDVGDPREEVLLGENVRDGRGLLAVRMAILLELMLLLGLLKRGKRASC